MCKVADELGRVGAQWHLHVEVLDEGNEWCCGRCGADVLAEKKVDLVRLPELLLLHFKRFEHRRGAGCFKLETEVFFPRQGLDMTPYVVQPQASPPLSACCCTSNWRFRCGGAWACWPASLQAHPAALAVQQHITRCQLGIQAFLLSHGPCSCKCAEHAQSLLQAKACCFVHQSCRLTRCTSSIYTCLGSCHVSACGPVSQDVASASAQCPTKGASEAPWTAGGCFVPRHKPR